MNIRLSFLYITIALSLLQNVDEAGWILNTTIFI